jgi:hypothetical protein
VRPVLLVAGAVRPVLAAPGPPRSHPAPGARRACVARGRVSRYREMVRLGLLCLLAAIACACSASGRPGRAPQPILESSPREGSAAVAAPEGPVADLVRRLVARRPARMSELEAVVGPIGMSFRDEDRENIGWLDRPRDASGEFTPLVPRLHIRYRFDMYHQSPTQPRDVGLEMFRLVVRGDPAIPDQILRTAIGSPRTVVDGGTSYSAFHPFYVSRDPGITDRFQITWYAEVPRFAIPEPDPQARAAWLRALAHRISTAQSIDEVDAFCRAAPAAAGIEIIGTLNRTANQYGRPAKDPRDYWIKLVPPARAKLVADAFGWGPVVGVSHDVHMSSWHIERRADTWLPTSGANAQWEIRASFTERPSGDAVKRAGSGPFDAHAVGADDELRSLAIAPRFK